MKFNRLTVTLMVALAFAISSRATFAADKNEVVDAVNRYLSNLEKDKIKTAAAMCDPEVSILDEFPPHAWHGPTACADWWKELLAYDEKSGITDGDATLGKPWTVDVTGDRAYFVAPMTYSYKQKGNPLKRLPPLQSHSNVPKQDGALHLGLTLNRRSSRLSGQWVSQAVFVQLRVWREIRHFTSKCRAQGF